MHPGNLYGKFIKECGKTIWDLVALLLNSCEITSTRGFLSATTELAGHPLINRKLNPAVDCTPSSTPLLIRLLLAADAGFKVSGLEG